MLLDIVTPISVFVGCVSLSGVVVVMSVTVVNKTVEAIDEASGNSVVDPFSVVGLSVVNCVSENLLVVSMSIKVVSNSVLFELDIIISNSEMVSI